MASSRTGGPPAKKAKTSNDSSDSESDSDLPICPYGERCYRKNPAHFKEFAHPKDDKTKAGTSASTTKSARPIDTSKLPACPFGAKCYRKNLIHYAEFSHPFTGGGDSELDTVPEDSGSDTDVYDDDEADTEKTKSKDKSTQKKALASLKKGPSLKKSYSQMTEAERRDLIKQAFEAKKQLEEELLETKKQVEEKEKQLDKLQTQVNEGVLLMDGEKEALAGDKVKYFDLVAERSYKEGSAAQAHFRLAESQFYRLLSGQATGTYSVKKVQYVVNPAVREAFKDAQDSLKETRGEEYSYPVLAFHGTQSKNITSIVEAGFKVPGQKGFAHRTDSGYYGRGVYFSEYPSYSMGYIQGCTKILLCQVLLGKVYQCAKLIQGKALMKGFDSHVSPNKKELIIFHSEHILPCYIVHYTTSAGEFKYIKPASERKIAKTADELMKLYWKASKTKKTNCFTGLYFGFSGKLSDSEENLQKLVRKHGALVHKGIIGGLFGGGGPVGNYFNMLVCTEKCLLRNVDKVKAANTNKSPIVNEQFVYDSILEGTKQDPDDYALGDID